jgi:hypothetical protein
MTTPAGWYPDPGDAGSQRYWDGARWTEHTAPAAPATAPPTAPAAGPIGTAVPGYAPAPSAVTISPAVIVGGLGAVLILVSTVLPWIDVAGFSENAFEKNLPWLLTGFDPGSFEEGTVGHGVFLVLFGLVVAGGAVLTLVGQRSAGTVAMLAGGTLSVLVGLAALWKFLDEPGLELGDLGIGLYLSIIAGAIAVAGGVLGSINRR